MRTDVLTISKQNPDLSDAQLNQVYENLNLASFHLSGTITSFPFTINDPRITSRSSVVNVVLGTPASVTSDLSWSTEGGAVHFYGTLASSASTTIEFDIAPTVTALGQWNDNVTPDNGSNSNGSWTKFPDGTLIQYGAFTVDLSANSYLEYTLTFPLRQAQGGFVAVPAFTAGVTIWSDPKFYSVIRRGRFADSGILRIGNAGTAVSGVIIEWMAIGRWK